jgi:alkylation response protein AidB-like acyl-CoA dehydrogenase
MVATQIRDNVGQARGPLADDPVGLADFARAASALRAARAGVDAAIEKAWTLAEAGQPITKDVQAEVCLALHYGCEVAVETTQTCHRLAGGAAAYAGNLLLRKLLDVQTARQHMIFGFGSRPILAKALVGLDVIAPPFIV